MPQFDLRGIKVAQYKNNAGVITYGTPKSAGGAMTVNLELTMAEGRLYAESTLAECMPKALGGTISIGTKYIPADTQKLLYGQTEIERVVNAKIVSSLKTRGRDKANPVGVAFYAPDMIDGVEKYTCVFISRAVFGQPSMVLQTLNETITFQTPTTTGAFMADHSGDQNIKEVAVVDDEADAIAWIEAVFGETVIDTDATLSVLNLYGLTLSPTFSSNTTTYTATTTAASTMIYAAPTTAGAALEIKLGSTAKSNGDTLALSAGSNVITVKVTATDGETNNTYTVTVTKS